MSKNLSANYYQENKESLQKKAREWHQNFSDKKKKKASIWLWTSQNIRTFSKWIFFLFLKLGPKGALMKYKKGFFLVNIRHFFRVDCFYFSILSLKVWSWNIRRFFKKFHFPKYKKSFFLRKYNNFFNLKVWKFHFSKYKKI